MTVTAPVTDLDAAPAPPKQRRGRRAAARRRGDGFRGDIEGLRAVAVLVVVLYHAGVPGLSGGYIGVDVFFVISGFLITGLLVREFDVDGKLSIADFYARRFRRILPAASLVIFVTLGLSIALLSVTRISSIARDALWTSVFAANFRFIQTGTDYLAANQPPSPFQHFWSLAVEEQFYLAWPMLLWGFLAVFRRARNLRWWLSGFTLALTLASLWWSIHQTHTNATVAYFSPFTRAWELGAGAFVAVSAIGLARIPRVAAVVAGWAGVALIVYATVRFTAATPFPGSAAGVPILGAVLLIVSGMNRSLVSPAGLLAIPPMQYVGRLSYSFYLWHWPILIIVVQHYGSLPLSQKLGLVAISFVISDLTYRFYENRIRRSSRLTRSTKASLAMGAAMVLVSVCVANAYIVTDDGRIAAAQARAQIKSKVTGESGKLVSTNDITAAVTAAVQLKAVPGTVRPPVIAASQDVTTAGPCQLERQTTRSGSCVFGNTTATQTVVLFGDSHAAQWLPALQSSATRSGFKIVVLTKKQCPLPSIDVVNTATKQTFAECTEWRNWALQQIATLKPALVLATSHIINLPPDQPQTFSTLEDRWKAGLETTLQSLKKSAARVVMLSDTPTRQDSDPTCLAANTSNPAKCSTPVAKATIAAHDQLEESVAHGLGIQFVHTANWVCTDTTCPGVINDMVVYSDESHITATYSRYLAYSLAEAIGTEGRDTDLASAVGDALKISKLPTNASNEIRAKNFGPNYDSQCENSIPRIDAQDPICLGGNINGTRTVVLLGDSRAAMWMPAFEATGRLNGWKVYTIQRFGCSAANIDQWSFQFNRPYPECTAWRQAAIARIATLKPDMVVLASETGGRVELNKDGKPSKDGVIQAQASGFFEVVNALKQFGPKIGIIGDIPVLPQVAADCLETHQADIQSCSGKSAVSGAEGNQMLQGVAKVTGATFANVTPWLCSTAGCPATIGGHVAYVDQFHISSNFAIAASGALATALGLT